MGRVKDFDTELNSSNTVKDFIESSRRKLYGSFHLHDSSLEDECSDWICTVSITRDDTGIPRINFRLLVEELDKHEGAEYRVDEFNHFLCGWYRTLIVSPKSMHIIQPLLDKIENEHPVLDEEQLGICPQCDEGFDNHDSANQPYCSSWCEGEHHHKPCAECGWSFDVRDVDGSPQDEGLVCEDCVEET